MNASLNSLCAALLVAGWIFIRRHKGAIGDPAAGFTDHRPRAALLDIPSVRAHAVCMSAAVAASALFLTSYLVYHGQAGSVSFRHGGGLRVVYYTILLSHTLLATLGVVPLVVVTLTRALRRDFARHARIAQVTFPIWLYVSVTGVLIYLLLYQWPFDASMASPN